MAILALAALNQTPLEWNENLRRIKLAIVKAVEAKADLLVLPEMCISGYGCEDAFYSDWLAAKAMRRLKNLTEFGSPIAFTVGLPVVHQGRLYNTVAVVDNGKLLGFTAKKYLANEGIHYEPRWFNPWPRGKVSTVDFFGQTVPFGDIVYEVAGHTIGIEICEDSWQTKNRPAEHFYEKKVDIILNCSASHFAFGKAESREQLVLKSSEAYRCQFVYVNMLGNEAGRAIYDGDRLVAAYGSWMHCHSERLPLGELALSVYDTTSVPSGSITPPKYSRYEEFTRAVTLGMYDYARKSGARGFTLSLSGGADSAACAVLAYLMRQRMGNSALHTFADPYLVTAYQASANSTEATRHAAETLASSLGVPFFEWSIEPTVEKFKAILHSATGGELTWESHDLALQNIQSRSRAPGIWLLANWYNHLLLTTGNRSEASVGYATMDGDTAGGLAPLGGIDKQFIREWLLYARDVLGFKALEPVCALEPSAELRPPSAGQTDEKDLMPYALLQRIEALAIGKWYAPIQCYEALRAGSEYSDQVLRAHVVRFYRMWARNQWKRERIAPSFHLDTYSVDPKTWCRFPILNGAWQDDLLRLEHQG